MEASVGGSGEQWARGGGNRVAPPCQSFPRRPRRRCAPGGCSEHARRINAGPPPPVAAPHANRRLGDRGCRKLGRSAVVAGRPVAGGAPPRPREQCSYRYFSAPLTTGSVRTLAVAWCFSDVRSLSFSRIAEHSLLCRERRASTCGVAVWNGVSCGLVRALGHAPPSCVGGVC